MRCIIKVMALLITIVASATVKSQEIKSIGFTGAWLNHRQSVAGGLAVTVQKDLFTTDNSSLSLGTTVKTGLEDKLGSGVIIPALVYFYGFAADKHVDKDSSGGRVNLFLDIPLLVHYNIGFGSAEGSMQNAGFYFGGGATYILTGYTDETAYSKPANFAGLIADGGLRLRKGIDINYAAVFPLKQHIGQINHPFFSEITLSILF